MDFVTKIKRLILSAGVEERAYRNVVDEINENNRKNVMAFCVFTFIILGVLFIVSFAVPSLSGNRMLYGIYLIPSIIIFILSRHFGKENKIQMYIMTYIYMAMLLSVGIILGTVFSPAEITATYIALLLTAPQVFTDRPYRMYLFIFFTVVVFIVVAVQYKDPITWSSDITNSLVFGALSCILCTYTINIRVSRYCLEETIRFMAENDQLTGLRNRNSYEQSIQKVSILAARSIYCVYVDVNGLHELNNTQGHEAGDRMLQYIATVMQNIFGKDETYRIGGDEYVALGKDRDIEELEKMILQMKQGVESAGYHVAVGLSYTPKKEIEIVNLIKSAEQKMYQDKSEYYRRTGIDRRRRRS